MDRIVLVTKPTRYQELLLHHHTEGAARFFLESRGQSFDPYLKEHQVYQSALETVQRQFPNDITTAVVTREDLPNFLFRESDLIVVCGPDGLFVNLAKYVQDQLVLTVNPDSLAIAGDLMLFDPGDVGSAISGILEGEYEVEKLPFVKGVIDDEQIVWGINDLFIGRKDQVSARYEIQFGDTEHQSSSGIIVSTGAGSSGWMKSIVAMVEGLSMSKDRHKLIQLPRNSDKELVFVVREPFISPSTNVDIVTGRITPRNSLVVISQMPEGGFIFSDGVIEKAVEWNAGSTVEVTVGDRFVNCIVPC